MTENLPVRVEVWPLGADYEGIWLLSGEDAWRSGNVTSDSEPHWEIERLLEVADLKPVLVHSTSWRMDEQAVVLTYVAVPKVADYVLADYPNARPVTRQLQILVGRPPRHSAVEPPAPRYVDVLLHALRHLRFLRDTDAHVSRQLGGHWWMNLEPLEPELMAMYFAAGAQLSP
jgi:hypothetical protein